MRNLGSIRPRRVTSSTTLEQPDLEPLAGERERSHDADRPAACNDDRTFGRHLWSLSDPESELGSAGWRRFDRPWRQ
jgi:hypothetical protein